MATYRGKFRYVSWRCRESAISPRTGSKRTNPKTLWGDVDIPDILQYIPKKLSTEQPAGTQLLALNDVWNAMSQQ